MEEDEKQINGGDRQDVVDEEEGEEEGDDADTAKSDRFGH